MSEPIKCWCIWGLYRKISNACRRICHIAIWCTPVWEAAFLREKIGFSLKIDIIQFLFSSLIYQRLFPLLFRWPPRDRYSSYHRQTLEWAEAAFWYFVRSLQWISVYPYLQQSKIIELLWLCKSRGSHFLEFTEAFFQLFCFPALLPTSIIFSHFWRRSKSLKQIEEKQTDICDIWGSYNHSSSQKPLIHTTCWKPRINSNLLKKIIRNLRSETPKRGLNTIQVTLSGKSQK